MCRSRQLPLTEQAGHPAILEHAAARLAGRAVEDGVLLVVDLPERVAASRARLAEAPVDEVDVLVALAGDPELERAGEVVLDRRREALDLVLVELVRESEGRELRPVQDLVRVRAPDPGERPLVAQERVQPPVVAGQDLAQLLGSQPDRLGAQVRELGLGLLRRLEPDAGALLRVPPRSARARRRSRSGA